MWQMPVGVYGPAAGGRLVVQLEGLTTAIIASVHRGKHSKLKTYILLTFEGSPRPVQHLFDDWNEALQTAREENLVIYNARTKKAFRCIWLVEPEKRTLNNMTFEEVALVPEEKSYFDTLPAVNARLYNIE